MAEPVRRHLQGLWMTFEEWWRHYDASIRATYSAKYGHEPKSAAHAAWNARGPEIDALIARLHAAEQENERLREALEEITITTMADATATTRLLRADQIARAALPSKDLKPEEGK